MSWIAEDPERFWSKVEKLPSGCWVWHGSINNGYSAVYNVTHERIIRASRIAWEECRGELPTEVQLIKTCRTRLCIAPAHRIPLVRQEPEE